VLDLDDLLLYWRALVLDDVVGPLLADSFDHVLVDEYQDVNGLQVDIVAGLRARRRDVTVVGDDFQAIYAFRSASARHILEFPTLFPDAEVVTLERNYRSTSAILNVANAVSEQDRDGYPKRLWTQRDGGVQPELSFPRDEGDQAQQVADRVLAAREEGVDLRAQAVLFRATHDSDLLELELTRRGIPFVKYGGLRYLDAAHVRDLVALLRLATNPADEVSWFRVLQLLDGVGPVRARRILDALRAPEGGPPQVGRWRNAAEHVPPGCLALADAVIDALAQTADGGGAGAQVERLCEALTPLIRLRYPDWGARVADYEQLVALARGAEDIRHFVSELVIDPPASTGDLTGPPHLDEDFLVLSTVHSAKGLEWEAVHVIAAYDGNFPADMNAANAEGIAEERRLFYVALTRARQRLHVYVPFRYYHRPHARDDGHGYGKASRFLTDTVQRLCSVTHAAEDSALRPGTSTPPRRIEISVDSLFG
jgi:DNA helicase II / ATP-dependent DNA helicase PcrA